MALRSGRPVDTPAASFERRLVQVSWLGIGAVALLCFWPLLLGRHFLYADLGNFHLPLRIFYAEGLASGAVPLWLPNLFCGYFLHGEGQVGMFHPIHLLLYRALPLGPAFALECTLAFPFALLGMTLFLRRFALPAAAALGGGVAFGFSTFLLVRYTHVNVVAVLAHMPWLLLLVDIALRTRHPRVFRNCCVGLSLLVASQILVGYPGAFVFSSLYVGLFALPLWWRRRDPLRLAGLLVAGGAGLLIGAVQGLPTLESFGESMRAGSSLEARFAQSLHPWNLLQPLAPYLFRQRVFQIESPNPVEQTFYLGAMLPVAVAWLLARRRALGGARKGLLALALASAVSIVLALGSYGGLLWVFAELPLLGQLRVPARFTLLLHLASAVALALAYADLLRVSREPSDEARRAARWLWLAPAASVAIAIGASVVGAGPLAPTESGRRLAGLDAIWLGPALAIVAASICFVAARGRRAALLLVVPFVALDQAGFALSLWWTEPPVRIDEHLASVPKVGDGRGRVAMGFSDAARVDANGKVFFDTSSRYIVHGDRLVWGYAGLMPRRRLRPYSAEALAIAGVSVERRGRERVAIADPLPRFRLVDRVEVGNDVRRAVAGLDLRTTAVVASPVAVERGPAGSVELLEERSGAIRLVVRAPTRQLLVIAESYHPGWQLTVDGTATPIERVYGDFIGAAIDAGEHALALDFRPRSVAIGGRLSLAGLLLLGALYWALGRQPPRPPAVAARR
jgi:hypothetical protein